MVGYTLFGGRHVRYSRRAPPKQTAAPARSRAGGDVVQQAVDVAEADSIPGNRVELVAHTVDLLDGILGRVLWSKQTRDRQSARSDRGKMNDESGRSIAESYGGLREVERVIGCQSHGQKVGLTLHILMSSRKSWIMMSLTHCASWSSIRSSSSSTFEASCRRHPVSANRQHEQEQEDDASPVSRSACR